MDIHFRGITKTFNGDTVLDNISLKLPSGSFNVLRGPNGSGKTTLIEIIAGILKPDFGDIYFGSIKVNDAMPFERRTFYIPQTLHKYWHLVDERLFCFIPERTVQENKRVPVHGNLHHQEVKVKYAIQSFKKEACQLDIEEDMNALRDEFCGCKDHSAEWKVLDSTSKVGAVERKSAEKVEIHIDLPAAPQKGDKKPREVVYTFHINFQNEW